MKAGSLIAIGTVVKAFGIRGELVIRPLTENVKRFKRLSSVFVGTNEANARETTVASVAVDGRGIRMMFANVSDRTAAEELVGSLVFVDDDAKVRLPKGTFFVHDLVGIDVVDENGNAVGTLKEVLKYPAQDVYVIDANGKDVLIPAVKEFVKKIDVAAKVMRVKLIDGMIDDAQALGESDED